MEKALKNAALGMANVKRPLPDIPVSTKQKQENATPKQHYIWNKNNSMEGKASSIISAFKGIIMVATIVLISLSEEIARAKSCDLEKALKSISFNYDFPCKYLDIKDNSTTLRNLGIASLAFDFIFSLLILIFPLLFSICKLLVRTFLPLVAIFSVFIIMEYNDILNSKTAEKNMNYVQVQSDLTIWLEKHYTSDDISSSDEKSNSWNKLFIEYDCCGINQVQGTTNDFDSTPWCTTSGSCQATSSQIPKTCCNDVSEDNYGSAPTFCHSSVNLGTFKSNCMIPIRTLSVVGIEEYHVSLLLAFLLIIGTLKIAELLIELSLISVHIYFLVVGFETKSK
nr:uncharacterized protein LOC109617614 [Crassostrea gigas]